MLKLPFRPNCVQGRCCLSLVRAGREGARDASYWLISGRNQEGTFSGASPLAERWLTRQTSASRDARSPSGVRLCVRIFNDHDEDADFFKASFNMNTTHTGRTVMFFLIFRWIMGSVVFAVCVCERGWKSHYAEIWRTVSTCREAGRILRCGGSSLVTCLLRSRFMTFSPPPSWVSLHLLQWRGVWFSDST